MRVFAWFLGFMALALLAIGAFTYPAWTLLHPHFDFPFHRLGERIGMLAVLVGFVLTARRLGLADLRSLGYGVPRREFLRELVVGLTLGIAMLAGMVALMGLLGLLDWQRAQAIPTVEVVSIVLKRLASALAIAFIEETCLRGAMQTGVARESGMPVAIALSALVFSATHFFASYHIAPEQVTAGSGWLLVSGTLHAFAHPLQNADAFLALFVVGLLLGNVRAITGNIAACVGLHAGWVWVILVMHELVQPQPQAPLRWLLSGYDGVVGWLVLGCTAACLLPVARLYRARVARRRASVGVSSAA